MASAVQIMCVIAYKGEGGTNAEVISRSLRTNPVVIRRLLKCLERQGLVTIRPGKDGGVRIARPPGKISLDMIYKAVEGDTDIFALRAGGNPNCPVNARMNDLLTPIFGATNSAVERVLARTTVGSLVKAIA
jgi:Rrf2 family protein